MMTAREVSTGAGEQRKIRLLCVAHSMERGGAEQSLFIIVKSLNRNLFACYLAAPAGPMREEFRPLCEATIGLTRGYVPISFDPLSYLRAIVATLVNSVRIWRFLRRHPIDVVLTNTGVIPAGPIAAWLTGLPCVTVIREILSPVIVRRIMFGIQGALNRRMIVNSEATTRALCPDGDSSHIVKIHGALMLNKTAQAAPLDNVVVRSLAEDVPVIGVVGNVHPVKGQDHFLRMAAELVGLVPRVACLIVGPYRADSRYYRKLIRLRGRYGLETRVQFTGAIDQIPALMARLDVLVVTSVTESFSRVSLEAMAAGKPVVAFDVGGVSEVVEDGVTGRLIPFGDCHAMADAVCSLLKNPQMAARMGVAGRARVEKEFNAADQCARIEAVLLEIFSGSAQGERTAMTA